MAAPIAGFQSLGQPQARAAALRAAQSGRLQRTLLVHGPAGAGKGAFTDDLLALLFCQADDPTLRPCNACRGCRDARARTHPDLVVGGPDRWREERATGESIVAVARRWLLASAGSPDPGGPARDPHRGRRPGQRAGAERAAQGARGAAASPDVRAGRRRAGAAAADDPLARPAAAGRAGPEGGAAASGWSRTSAQAPDRAELLARLAGGLTGRAIEYARGPELLKWREATQRELLGLIASGTAERFDSVRHLLDAAARVGGAGGGGDGAARTTRPHAWPAQRSAPPP